MKKSLLGIVILLFAILNAIAQPDVILNTKRFNTPNAPYLENYIKIFSKSIQFKKNEFGGVQYNIRITQLLKKDTLIIDYKKYILKPNDSSKLTTLENLIDLQRFSIENNTNYSLEIIIEDLFSKAAPVVLEKEIEIAFPLEKISFSDVEFIEQYSEAKIQTELTKSGYNIIPLVDEFLGNDFDKIAYYLEIYNTDKALDSSEKYLLMQFIETYDNNALVGELNKLKRYSTSLIQPVLNLWDISELPTGNYNIVIQLKDKENIVFAEKKVRFQRLNLKNNIQISDLNKQGFINTFADKIPKDSLDEEIRSLHPIASELEQNTIKNQLGELTEKMKREFIYQFWNNKNKSDPEKEWRNYLKQLNYAQQQYSYRNRKGYQTDRGRIFLLYGFPNSINDNPNPERSYPYQVWHYYKAGKYNNKTCIFYTPSIGGDDYILLHSDIPGEIKDVNWQRTVKKRTNSMTDDELHHQSWEQY